MAVPVPLRLKQVSPGNSTLQLRIAGTNGSITPLFHMQTSEPLSDRKQVNSLAQYCTVLVQCMLAKFIYSSHISREVYTRP